MAQNSLRLVEDKAVDKSKALDAALSQIERAFGKGSIMRLGANEQVVEIETVPTGSLGLDIALGVGGLPRGRIVEIYGPESSGKTTLALHTVAEAQKKGGICAFVDAEHALDPVYARKLGVDLENLLISQPDTGEQALEICDTLVRSGAIDVLVVDSVAALTPRAEIEAVSLRIAWLISLAWRPGRLSPISPSSSALGVSAATESTTSTSMAPERTSVSQISSACSPVSGCEIYRFSTSTPQRAA